MVRNILLCDNLSYVYPTTNGGKQNGSSVRIYKRCIHVFARLAPICMLSRCLLTKFLHRSSVGRLSRVRCWLGTITSGQDRADSPCSIMSRKLFSSAQRAKEEEEEEESCFNGNLMMSSETAAVCQFDLRARYGVCVCVSLHKSVSRVCTLRFFFKKSARIDSGAYWWGFCELDRQCGG